MPVPPPTVFTSLLPSRVVFWQPSRVWSKTVYPFEASWTPSPFRLAGVHVRGPVSWIFDPAAPEPYSLVFPVWTYSPPPLSPTTPFPFLCVLVISPSSVLLLVYVRDPLRFCPRSLFVQAWEFKCQCTVSSLQQRSLLSPHPALHPSSSPVFTYHARTFAWIFPVRSWRGKCRPFPSFQSFFSPFTPRARLLRSLFSPTRLTASLVSRLSRFP